MTTVDGSAFGYWDDIVGIAGSVLVAPVWGGWDGTVTAGPQTRSGTATATWGGFDAAIDVGDGVAVAVYDLLGTELQAVVESAKPQYRIELPKGGTASLSLLLDDAAAPSMVNRALVKMTCRGRTEGFRVNGEGVSLAVDGHRWLTFGSMPSLIGCLHDAPVYPQGGLPTSGAIDENAPTTRAFGPMNPRGPWYVPADWVRPLGVLITDSSIREGYPKDLASTSDVYWIAPSPGPEVEQPEGTVVHFRREFSTTAQQPVEFLFTADNYLSLWLDGQEIITPDYNTPFAWKHSYTWSGVLQPGDHVIYARVENARRAGGPNPLGLVGAVFKLDRNGDHAGVLIHTHPAYWWASTVDVGWYAGQILYQLMVESQAAGDAGPSMLSMTFDPYTDSAGVAWSGTRLSKQFNVMTDMLDDVVSMLSQDGIDVTADGRNMTLDAWVRLGADRSGTVAEELGDSGGNLVQYDTKTSGTRANCCAAQLADGRWHTVIDTAGVAALGGKRVWMSVQLGTTSSPEAAEVTMRQMLAETAQPITAATAQPSTLTGTQFLRDYGLGDSITTPGKRGSGTLKQRCFAYNVDGTNDVVKIWPEFIEDPT